MERCRQGRIVLVSVFFVVVFAPLEKRCFSKEKKTLLSLLSLLSTLLSLFTLRQEKKNSNPPPLSSTMAPSPSKMLAFGASPGPKKRVNVTASASSSAASSVSQKQPDEKKSKSGGGGGKAMMMMQLVAAVAALALAAAVARWLGGGSGGAVVVDVSSSSPPSRSGPSAVAAEVAFDADDPDAQPLPGLHVDGGSNAPRRSNAVGSWPARVRVERQRLRPRKRGAMERAVEVRTGVEQRESAESLWRD